MVYFPADSQYSNDISIHDMHAIVDVMCTLLPQTNAYKLK